MWLPNHVMFAYMHELCFQQPQNPIQPHQSRVPLTRWNLGQPQELPSSEFQSIQVWKHNAGFPVFSSPGCNSQSCGLIGEHIPGFHQLRQGTGRIPWLCWCLQQIQSWSSGGPPPSRPKDYPWGRGIPPSLRPIYLLSQEELLTLHKFIDKNTSTGFIRPSRSPHGAPVLFIQKKDGSLRLCCNFWGIN